MLCKCSGKYIDIYFILKITFSFILSDISLLRICVFRIFFIHPSSHCLCTVSMNLPELASRKMSVSCMSHIVHELDHEFLSLSTKKLNKLHVYFQLVGCLKCLEMVDGHLRNVAEYFYDIHL